MARYLVTGGCGFIGSHLTDRLIKLGHDVIVVDDLSTGRRGNVSVDVPVIVADVGDTAAFGDELGAIDGCFHLAAVASVERARTAWRETHRVNLSAFIGLLETVAKGPRPEIPIVFASSAAVYGDNPDLPLSETSLTQPISAYGADKLGCEQHARAGGLGHGLRTTGLRFFNVFGPRQDPASPYTGVISIFARRALDGKPITIHGDGEQSRDFIFVADVVAALIAASGRQGDASEIVNVCSGQAISISTLASKIADAVPHPVTVERVPARSGDIRHSLGDAGKMRDVLGVGADTPFETGLRRTLDWMAAAGANG